MGIWMVDGFCKCRIDRLLFQGRERCYQMELLEKQSDKIDPFNHSNRLFNFHCMSDRMIHRRNLAILFGQHHRLVAKGAMEPLPLLEAPVLPAAEAADQHHHVRGVEGRQLVEADSALSLLHRAHGLCGPIHRPAAHGAVGSSGRPLRTRASFSSRNASISRSSACCRRGSLARIRWGSSWNHCPCRRSNSLKALSAFFRRSSLSRRARRLSPPCCGMLWLWWWDRMDQIGVGLTWFGRWLNITYNT